MELRPQDIVVLLKLIVGGDQEWTYRKLGRELFMSDSQVFRSIERAKRSHLLEGLQPPPGWEIRKHLALSGTPQRANLKEFLVYGVKYAFPVERGGPTRGIPTAESAPSLKPYFSRSVPPPFPSVWPYAQGSTRGVEFSPLYKNVPQAALRDPKLYELLALVDTIREGRAREREIAIRELDARIDSA